MNSILYQMPDADYRAATGLSNSQLREFAISPARYKASLEEPREVTPELAFGIRFHEMLLTPDAPSRIAVRPAGLDMRTKEGKAWREAQSAKEAEITAEQEDTSKRMVEAIRAHPHAGLAFKVGRPEVSVFREFKTPSGIVQLKGRIDWVNDGNCLVDAKTTLDARERAFTRSAVDYGYFQQAAFYLDFLWNPLQEAFGTPTERKDYFVFVAVEKRPPFGTMLYRVPWEERTKLWPKIQDMLERFAICQQSGVWPGYPDTINDLRVPKWLEEQL